MSSQTFDKFVIERSPGVYVSVDGGDTKTFTNTKMWSNVDLVKDELNAVWKPGKFKFLSDIPHNMIGKMDLIGPFTDKIVKTWKIKQVSVSVTVSDVEL